MQRFILAAALISLIFCTSGCVKTSYNIKIDKKNNITISETEAINYNLFKSFITDKKELAEFDKEFEAGKKELAKDGYKTTDYEQNGFKGITSTKEFPKNSLKSKDLPSGFTASKEIPLEVTKEFFKTYYHIELQYDPKKSSIAEKNINSNMPSGIENNKEGASINSDAPSMTITNEDGSTTQVYPSEVVKRENGDMIEEHYYYDDGSETVITKSKSESESSSVSGMDPFNKMSDSFSNISGLAPSIDLTITIPYKATKSNATKAISDTEYFWQLKPGEKNSIYVDYEKYNYVNIIVAILFAIIFIFSGLYYKKFMNTSSW